MYQADRGKAVESMPCASKRVTVGAAFPWKLNPPSARSLIYPHFSCTSEPRDALTIQLDHKTCSRASSAWLEAMFSGV